MDIPFINSKLIANPVNWAIILLMLIIGVYALHFVAPSLFPSLTN